MATSQRLTKSEVENITAEDVHKVLSRTMLADGFDVVYDMEKSEGPYLFDKKSGKKYLDLFSFFASWPISHNHEKLKADKKFLNQIAQVALHNPANSDIYTIEMAQFVATFERVAMPAEFKHLFFVQGGSQAVENALKTAMDWKVRKNLAEGKGEKGNLIVHFKEAFHGRGGYTMSLTNTQDPNKYKYFALFKDWPRIHNPKAFFPLEDPNNLKKTVESEKKALNELTEVLNRKADEIAAIILEPVQGEGGDNHFRPEFWQALRKIADKYSVLLIADEVQAGMGLSGKFWTWQHLGATPDIVCFGKKSQVCGIMATSKIDTVKDNVFVVSSRINSTWGGNLVDMVRARKFLEIIEEDKLVDNAQTVGAYWLKQLQVLQKEFPAVVSNVRGKGLLLAFDVASPDLCNKIKQLAYQKNVLIISCGTQTIRFRPFLDTNVAHVDEVVKVLKSIFAELQKAKL